MTSDGIYIKDLSIIKSHPLNKIMIVDNSVCSFGLQLDNGIPIVPFYHDEEDIELLHLSSYLISLSYEDDLVKANADTFKLRQLLSSDLETYLKTEQ